MNITKFRTLFVSVCVFPLLVSATHSSAEADDINRALQDHDRRLRLLEEESAHADSSFHEDKVFNPAISVVLDGIYASYKNDPEDYSLPGYALGREAGLAPEGFSLGHSEIIFRSAVDDMFYGQFSLAIAEHDNEIKVELEEAFFETLSLGGGFNLRGGRFYSAIGYLNQQHRHVWDFYDAPLVYRGLFGDQYFDDGLRLSYVTPTDFLINLGVEALSGSHYPAGGHHDGVGSWTAFANIGDDVGATHNWRAGMSYMSADNAEREHGGHVHANTPVEVPLFTGDSRIIGANAVYRWAPDGNFHEPGVKLQLEYFKRDESGDISLLNSSPLETSTLESRQSGWYLQAVWQFVHHWRAGLRYDMLDSDNSGSNLGVLDEAGLIANAHQPERFSIMTEWIPGEFSRVRLQYNLDDSYQVTDNQLYLQYTFIMGSHGAHSL